MQNTHILGGGLVGSLLALMMSKLGKKVTLIDQRPDIRINEFLAGRSINLALSERGLHALRKIGVEDEVLELGIPMYGRMVHTINGESNFQPYSQNQKAIYSISRSTLNLFLINKASKDKNISILFDKKCQKVDSKNQKLIFNDQSEINFEQLLATDGAFSVARKVLNTDHDIKVDTLTHSYKEIDIPALNGNYALEKNCLHIWPRKSFMMIALPNTDGSFTGTLFLENNKFDQIKTENDVLDFLLEFFPDIVEITPNIVNQFQTNPTSKLSTVYVKNWFSDNICLLGDAAHAIVPFYGQGMNCGFEDCAILYDLINSDIDQSLIFEKYFKNRKINADAIAQLALNNFLEMRDLVSDPVFLQKKKTESRIKSLLGDNWNTLYEMVSFTNVPYSEALQKGKNQDQLITKLINQQLTDQQLLNFLVKSSLFDN